MTSTNSSTPTEKTIFPIVLACDSKYVPYMAVCLFSIVMNARTPNVLYKIYLLHTDFTEHNIRYFQKTLESINNPNVELAFIKIDNVKDERFFQNGSYITISTYYRLLIPMIFTNYDKILYLDGDLVVTTDVFTLNSVDLGNNLTAGCSDSFIYKCVYYDFDNSKGKLEKFNDNYAYHKLEIKPGEIVKYFNAGVLLFNLKRFRELHLEDIYFKTILEMKNPIYMDQDIINYVNLKYSNAEQIVYLDNKYNHLVHDYQWFSKIPEPKTAQSCVDFILNHLEDYAKNYLPDANLGDSIYHFIGPKKPWNTKWHFSYGFWWACVLAMPNAQEYIDNFNFVPELERFCIYLKERFYTYPRKTNDNIDFSQLAFTKSTETEKL